MKVALRDGDTSYFTEPGRLESVYHDVWSRIPVGLAVVPHAAGFVDKAVPEKYWDAGRAFPLAENAPLIASLREHLKAGHVTIAQHGFTHEDFADGHEFQAAPDIESRLARGQAYLEGVLDTRIRVFVPPHNALSKRGLRAVGAAGLNLLGSFLSFRPSLRPWDAHTPGNWWRVRQYREKTGRSKADRLVFPHVLRYRKHMHEMHAGEAIHPGAAASPAASADGTGAVGGVDSSPASPTGLASGPGGVPDGVPDRGPETPTRH